MKENWKNNIYLAQYWSDWVHWSLHSLQLIETFPKVRFHLASKILEVFSAIAQCSVFSVFRHSHFALSPHAMLNTKIILGLWFLEDPTQIKNKKNNIGDTIYNTWNCIEVEKISILYYVIFFASNEVRLTCCGACCLRNFYLCFFFVFIKCI